MKQEPSKKDILAKALAEANLKSGDITTCDSCECYVLLEHTQVQYGSMGKEMRICPDCDLPEKWHSKFSNEYSKRFFVYFDALTGKRHTQWSHPNEGNPLFIKHDKGASHKRKRI